MDIIYSKCGFICSNCASYKDNIKTIEARRRTSEGWRKYLGFKLSPEKLKPCDGCKTPDEENPTRYLNCKVRQCAFMNGAQTCAHCSGFPCEDTSNISFTQDKRPIIEEKLGYSMPEEDYISFVECFEGMKHLENIRAMLESGEIVDMKTFSAVPRTAEIPDVLPLPEGKIKPLELIHKILCEIDSEDNVTFARKIVLSKRRPKLLKLLWMFGTLGELIKTDRVYLRVDAETYSAQKIISYPNILNSYIDILKQHGIECKINKEAEDWKTPSGGLRKRGWSMKLAFSSDDDLNINMLKSLIDFTHNLQKVYGKNAFRHFSRADMRVYI
ncbi:DUF3795 domain-containing protein [candidate division KSB1 bacterium]